MPELPEVETIRRQLAPRLTQREVIDAGSFASQKFSPAIEVIGTTIEGVERRAKYLIISTDDDRELVVHLGMTGRFQFSSTGPDLANPHLRAWWRLTGPDGPETLEFVDTRRFGRIRVVAAGDYRSIPTLHQAGPEPWDPALTAKAFHRSLSRSRRAIKTQLLSQRPIAGVGNIYADEGLWDARVNPRATRLGLDRAGRLLVALRAALERGVNAGGTTLRDYRGLDGSVGSNQEELRAYGRGGEPCLRCGTEMRSGQVDARSTTWCPACQRY